VTTPSLSATNPRVPRGYQRSNGPGPGSRSGGTSRRVSGAMTSTAYPTTASRTIFRSVDHARKLLGADPVIGGAIGTGGLACSRELSWSAEDGQERWPELDCVKTLLLAVRAAHCPDGQVPSTTYFLASSIRLNGVSVARRNLVKPPSANTCASRTSPAWAPRPRPTSCDREFGVQTMVDAA